MSVLLVRDSSENILTGSYSFNMKLFFQARSKFSFKLRSPFLRHCQIEEPKSCYHQAEKLRDCLASFMQRGVRLKKSVLLLPGLHHMTVNLNAEPCDRE